MLENTFQESLDGTVHMA